MLHEQQHWNKDKSGELLGIWDINAYAANGADIWDKIDEVIREYAKVHTMEMEILIRENANISNSRKNDLAMSGKNDIRLRWGASIPPGLLFKLEQIEPMLFSNKKLFHKFLKKYKGFRICKTV